MNGLSRQVCVHTQSSATGTCQSQTSQIAGPIRGHRRSTGWQLRASLCTASSPLCLVPRSSCSLLVSCQGVFTYVTCWSVCDRDQNGIKWLTFFLGADQGIKMNSATNINRSRHFLRYWGGVATFLSLDPCKIKRLRALEGNDQAIRQFSPNKFLDPSRKCFYGQFVVSDYPLAIIIAPHAL